MAASPIDSISGKLGGTPCFAGTRVTIDMLFMHLGRGGTVDTFVESYDSISREQAIAVIHKACDVLNDERALPLVVEGDERTLGVAEALR